MSASGALRRRLQATLGVGAVVVAFGGMFVAAALVPWYSVFDFSLSTLGRVGLVSAPFFNGGLLAGGALGAGFVVAVWAGVDDGLRQGGAFVLLLAMVFMAMVGAFPLPATAHFPVAVAFFLFMTLGLFVWGAGDYAAGRPARGGALVVASVLHVAAWFWWLVFGWPGRGIAVPELVGALGLGVWALWLAAEASRDVRAERAQL